MEVLPETASDTELDQLIKSRRVAIEEYKQQLAVLCLSRNSRLPISKLPVELLTGIFIHYARTGGYGQPYRDGSAGVRWSSGLVLAQICHHWRGIALSSPLIWSYLDTNLCLKPHLLEISLSRSAGAALDVSISWATSSRDRHNLSDGVKRLLQECHRIRDLKLLSVLGLIAQSQKQLTPCVFSRLECLEINIQYYATPTDTSILLQHLLQHSPILRSVSFGNAHVDVETLLALPPTVAHLYVPTPPWYGIDLCRVIDAMQRLSQLETLSLNIGSSTAPLELEGIEGETVSLPKLKHLTMKDRRNIIPFFESFILPPTIRVRLETDIDDHQIVPIFTKLLSQSHSTCLTRSPKFTVLCELETFFSFGLCEFGQFDACDRCQLFVKLWGCKPIDTWIRCLNIPSTKAILSHCESLRFKQDTYGLPHSMFVELLSLAPDIETLLVSVGGDLNGGLIIDALRLSPNGTIPLAKLKRLDLTLDVKDPNEHFNKEELCQCLEERKEHGCKLRSLSIRSIRTDGKTFDSYSPEIMARLRAAVDVYE
ncbi:hypothetical protein QCA50_017523 [Cerrena zonata]|uniref:F-box domain-containing protein n=1 Tax=Cerrena zonata TaxID=2478898 RepID=A0AAW0FIW5_9APHY